MASNGGYSQPPLSSGATPRTNAVVGSAGATTGASAAIETPSTNATSTQNLSIPSLRTPATTTNTSQSSTTAVSSNTGNNDSNGTAASAASSDTAAAASKSDSNVLKDLSEEQQKEFDLCKITRYVDSRSTSQMLEYVHLITVDESKVKGNEDFIASSKALQQVLTGNYMVCILCKELGRPLGGKKGCLRKLQPNKLSNYNTHANEQHAEQMKKKKEEKLKRTRGNKKEEGNKQKKQKTTSVTNFYGTAVSKKKEANKALVSKYEQLLFDLINDNGLPDRLVECPKLRKLVEFLIDHGKELKGPDGSYPHMGRRKVVTIQCKSFQALLDNLKALLKEIDDWFIEETGQSQSNITIASDVWDARSKKLLGLSVIFMHPVTLEVYRVPIALLPPSGEKAHELAETSMLGLERAGIKHTSLYRSVNDNCKTAVKTGRYILVGGSEFSTVEGDDNYAPKGLCIMHLADLAYGLALSLVKRTQNGRVINYWPPFMDSYKKLKLCALSIYDGKNRTRRKDYEDTLGKFNMECPVISVPNDTRVAGAQLLMKQMLRSMWNLRFYASQSQPFEAKSLSLAEWDQIAEFVAIMSLYFNLCMSSQADRIETAGEMPLTLALLLVEYEYGNVVEVVDTSGTKKWTAETPFEELPTVKRAASQEDATRLSIDMLSSDSIQLRKRCVDSFNEYFNVISDDGILAMIVNPLLLCRGLPDLEACWDSEGGKYDRFVNKAKGLLKAMVEQMFKPDVVSANEGGESGDDVTDEDIEDAFLNPKEKLAKQRRQASKSTQVKSASEKASQVVDSWFNMDMNPERELKEQYIRKNDIKDASKFDWQTVGVDWKRVRENDTLYISSKFDLREWWKSVGRSSASQFSKIYPVFVIVSSLPAANGFQERTFSICTVFDDSLRQRLKPKRFEMAVLLAVNEALRKWEPVSDEEAKEIVEKVIATFSTSPEFDAAEDLGLDPEADDFTTD